MKIAIGQLGHETNSFVPGPCDRAHYGGGRFAPEQIPESFTDTATYLGGMIRAAQERNAELVPLPAYSISTGAVLARELLDEFLDDICSHLEAVKDGLDGICFALHGAGCAVGADNMELATIQALRRVVGPDMPIMCSADLHANNAPALLRQIQGLFGLKENPHTDLADAGYLAMNTLIATLRGELQPRMHLVQLPLLVTPAAGNTRQGPMAEIKELFSAYCREHALIDATFFHGFSAADIPDSMASVLVVADGCDPTEHAKHLARCVWSRRHRMVAESLTPDQAIDRALAGVKNGYAVINEASDNPGSGCPGDGTHTLRALLERNIPGSIFQYIYDPEVARQAHEAGVGARISIRLGGKSDTMSGKPIELRDVEVLSTPEEATYICRSPMNHGLSRRMGLTARLRHGNVEFIVVSTRLQALDDGAIAMTGSDISRYKLVCLKSANHFRGFFDGRADAIVAADPPGMRCSDLRQYPYKRICRPIYPLDPDTTLSV